MKCMWVSKEHNRVVEKCFIIELILLDKEYSDEMKI